MATAKTKTTAVAKAKMQLPADAQARMLADMESFKSRLAAPSGNRIQVTQDRMFKNPATDTKHPTVSGVIVDFIAKKAFYETAFDKDNIVPPDCYAMDFCKHDDLHMADDSPMPQVDQGDACKGCAMNQFKTAANGKGKACGDNYVLALLPPDAGPDTPLQTLNISATGVKPYSKYIGDLVNNGLPPYAVITEFSMDPNVDYSSVRAGNPQKADPDLMALAFSRKEEARKLLEVRPDFSAPEEVAPAKPAKGKAVAAKKPAARKAN